MSHATQIRDRRDLDDSRQMIHRSGLPSHVTAEVCQRVHQAVLTTVTWTLAEALHVLGDGLGLSLRALQEAMRLTLGEVLSLHACNRVVLALAQRSQAFQRAPLVDPPPVVLVDGMWGNIAYPTGAVKVDAQGRRRAATREQTRVILTALGVWPEGHWDILFWQIATT